MTRLTTLLRAAHPGPALAVTVLAGLLGVAVGLGPLDLVLVVAAVGTGQLSIGWSNDLLDAARDRSVGRTDKPLATGELDVRLVRAACLVAVALTVPLSFALGPTAGLMQLLTVIAGWSYNLGLKSSVWSWLPYAVAFGALPAFVSLVDDVDSLPPWWMVAAGALLGVGAHLVNVLPDLDDDAATGVHGMPHRLGARRASALAAAVLVAATVVIVVGAPVGSRALAATALVVVAVLAVVALVSTGRTPFRAAIAMALVDVAMLVWAR
jgi:4-hydroxybenzoate polyprenyltransferase